MNTRPTIWQLKEARRQAWRKLSLAEKRLEYAKHDLVTAQARCRERLARLHRERINITTGLEAIFILEDRIVDEGVYWEMIEVEQRFKSLNRRLRRVSSKIDELNMMLRKSHRKVRDAKRQLGISRLRYMAAKQRVWRASAHLFAPVVAWSKKQQLAKSIRVPVEYRNNLHVVMCGTTIHVYFGGLDYPTDVGHGHYVIEDGFVTYRRDPGVPHGEGRLEPEWGTREYDCL